MLSRHVATFDCSPGMAQQLQSGAQLVEPQAVAALLQSMAKAPELRGVRLKSSSRQLNLEIASLKELAKAVSRSFEGSRLRSIWSMIHHIHH